LEATERFTEARELMDGSTDNIEESDDKADKEVNEEIAGLHRELEEAQQETDRLTEANRDLQRRLTLNSGVSQPDSPHPPKRPCGTHTPPHPTPPPVVALAGPSRVAGDSG
jgi:hypothetical protein